MEGETWRARGARAWQLARRQHGVLTRAQLLELGYSEKAIEHRLRSGRLHRLRRGVYAVGRAEIPREGRWMAATLACDPEAYLSHRSAAALYGIGNERGRLIEISVRKPNARRHADIRVFRRPSLPSHDAGTVGEIPVTSPVRTLLDLATLEPPNRVERAVNEADKREVIDPDSLRKALDDYTGTSGIRALLEVLDQHTFLLSDDELELLFRPLARGGWTPPPKYQRDGQRLRG